MAGDFAIVEATDAARAGALYANLGFRDASAYGGEALPGTRFMALAL